MYVMSLVYHNKQVRINNNTRLTEAHSLLEEQLLEQCIDQLVANPVVQVEA